MASHHSQPASTPAAELRRAPRLQLQQFFPVFHSGTDDMIGRVADLSASGMMLICHSPLDVDTEYALDIRLPPGAGAAALKVQAVSVWCRHNPNNQAHYGAGMRFSNITGESLSLLEALLREPGVTH